jgi:hypothetical protein
MDFIWKIFNPNYDFLVPLCLYLVQKNEKNAVANEKCVFATCTEFTWYLLPHGTLIATSFFEFIIDCNSFRSLFTLTTSGIFPFFLARQPQGVLLDRFPPLKPCANENFPYPLDILRLGATLTRP